MSRQALGLSAQMQSSVAAKAEVIGESRAAGQFFQTLLADLPKNVTKAKQDEMVKALESEVATLAGNVNKLKSLQKQEVADKQKSEHVKSSLQGKDRAMME